jgi:hypothetical protein
MTLDELIHDVEMFITMSGALPKILPRLELERIIVNEAIPYFHENYHQSLIKEYIYIPRDMFTTEQYTKYNYVQLPCHVQSVTWLYMVENRSMFSLGVSAPDLSVNMGVTNQPYLSSYATTVGELGVYKVVIDSFSDMLNQLSKNTLKYDYNFASNQLNILTSIGQTPYSYTSSSVVAEVYSHIPNEDLFDLDHFRRYVRAKANMQLGRLLLRYDYTQPGGVKINSDAVLSEGKTDLDKVVEEMDKLKSNSSFFFMVKR